MKNSRRDSPPRREFFVRIIPAHHTVGPQFHHAQALVGELVPQSLRRNGFILGIVLLLQRLPPPRTRRWGHLPEGASPGAALPELHRVLHPPLRRGARAQAEAVAQALVGVKLGGNAQGLQPLVHIRRRFRRVHQYRSDWTSSAWLHCGGRRHHRSLPRRFRYGNRWDWP